MDVSKILLLHSERLIKQTKHLSMPSLPHWMIPLQASEAQLYPLVLFLIDPGPCHEPAWLLGRTGKGVVR